MFIGMINKGIIKPYDPHVLSLEYISPVSLLIMLGDREPHNHQEILNRIIAHIKHFMAVYGV